MPMTPKNQFQKILLFIAVLSLIVGIGVMDYFTGSEISFSVFYLIPIILFSAYADSRKYMVIVVVFFSAITWGVSEVYSHQTYSSLIIPFWNTGVRLVMFMSIGLLFHALRNKNLFLSETNIELESLNQAVSSQKQEIESVNVLLTLEKERSETLLSNILPVKIIDTLKDNTGLIADHYDECTVMFTDFKDFSILAEELSTTELVSELNHCFSAFDGIMNKYGIEKIKTIEDSYMCVSGIPVQKRTHALDMILAAMEIVDFMKDYKEKRLRNNKKAFEIRIGIHTGHLIAGVVGKYKYSYDVWGETVNSASRFESAGEVGEINVSETTYQRVKDYFECTDRGLIAAKNMGEVNMYFIERLKPFYSADVGGRMADPSKFQDQ